MTLLSSVGVFEKTETLNSAAIAKMKNDLVSLSMEDSVQGQNPNYKRMTQIKGADFIA